VTPVGLIRTLAPLLPHGRDSGDRRRAVVLDVDTGAPATRTALSLTNEGTTTRTVTLSYTPSFGRKEGAGSIDVVIGAGQQLLYPNIVSTLRSRGLAIPEASPQGRDLAVSYDATAGEVHVTARTTTPTRAPQPEGTVGLAYDALAPGAAITSRGTVFGLRQSATERSNVAVYNPERPRSR